MRGASANISSPEVLRTFRHRFIEFTEQARIAVEEATRDARAVSEWLRREQLPHWRRQLRHREEEAERARREYIVARHGDKVQSKVSAVDERKAFERAQRLKTEVEEKIRTVRHWLMTLEHESLSLLQPCAKLSTLLATQSPKALMRLDQMLDSLDDYLRKSSSGDG